MDRDEMIRLADGKIHNLGTNRCRRGTDRWTIHKGNRLKMENVTKGTNG